MKIAITEIPKPLSSLNAKQMQKGKLYQRESHPGVMYVRCNEEQVILLYADRVDVLAVDALYLGGFTEAPPGTLVTLVQE